MTRQRLRVIQRRIDEMVSDQRPRTRSDWLHENRELVTLLDEIGLILLRRLDDKPVRNTSEDALYYYLIGTLRR